MLSVTKALDGTMGLYALRHFMGRVQKLCFRDGLNGEEGEWFHDKAAEMARVVETMPKTYEQDGKGDQAIACLHYFTGGCDWWITEKDCEDGPQHQAFGLADIGYGGELGYISIAEITAA